MSKVTSKLHSGIEQPLISNDMIAKANNYRIEPQQSTKVFIDNSLPTHNDDLFLHSQGGYLNVAPISLQSGKADDGAEGGNLVISGLARQMDNYLKDFHMTRKDDVMNRRDNVVVPIDQRMLSRSRHR